MNWLDAVFLAVLLWLTYAAFQAGFIREIITVVGAVIGVALAGLFYKDLANDLFAFVDNPELRNIIAFGSVFVACALAGQLLAMVLKPTMRMLQLGIVDQLGGAAFGFVKALVFIQVFILTFVTFPRWGLDEAIEESFSGSLMVENVPVLEKILPSTFDIAVDQFVARPDEGEG